MTAGGQLLPEGSRLVHIGPHKTGSTAIQVALDALGDRLTEHGVSYVTTGGSYRPRKAGWALGVRGRPSGSTKPPPKHWRRFVEAVAASEATRVCVSNEDFGRATPRQVTRIVEDLGGDRVHVVAVARRLDRYLSSQWQERVKAGDDRAFETWLRVVLDTDSPDPDWDRRNVWFSHDVRALVERWVDVVGPDRFTLVVADEGDHGQLPRTFESLLGLPVGFVVPDPSRSNRGLSWAETELVRATNEVLEGRGCTQSQRRPLLIRGFLREMQARPMPAGPKSPPLPEWAAERLRELSDRRVQDVVALATGGVHLVGDPELMRMPADVDVASPPLDLPPVDLETASQALASALLAEPPRPPDEPDEPDEPAPSPEPDETAGASGWSRSHTGRLERIGGNESKLCSGGGDDVAHSNVPAPHGFSPAGSPRRQVRNTFHRNGSTATASR
jgi:hypothetical protein